MKKYFLSIVALAGMLFATSCQESLVEPQMEGPTTFTVQLPDAMGTKAIGDASSVNTLYVAVYNEASSTATAISKVRTNIDNGEATVELNLIQGVAYDIVFWAQKSESYVNSDSDLITIDVNKDFDNSEDGAVFYAYVENFVPNGTSNEVTLRRPFAQLNLGTTTESLTTAVGPVEVVSTSLQITEVATKFVTVSGLGENTATRTLNTSGLVNEDLTVNGTTYKRLSMDYLTLVDGNKTVVDVVATIIVKEGGIERTIVRELKSVPVMKNVRTNIVGNFISSESTFIVEVDDTWNEAEEEVYDVEWGNLLYAAQNGGEVTLSADVKMPHTLIVADDKEMVLNLNGHDIIVDNESGGLGVGDAIVVYGKLTIKGEGKVQGNTRAVWARGNYGAEVRIEGGNYIGSVIPACEVIYASGDGKIEIYGGTFEAKEIDNTSFAAPQYAVLNLYGNGAAGNDIKVYGGSFKNFNPADNISENPKHNFCAPGYGVSEVDGWYIVTESSTAYVSTPDQLNAALGKQEVNVIKLCNAQVFEGVFTITRSMTIQSEGENGTLKGRVYVLNGANVTFQNVDFDTNDESTKVSLYGSNAFSRNYTSVVMPYGANDVRFESCNFKNLAQGRFAYSSNTNTGKAYFVGCSFSGTPYYVIYSYANVRVENCIYNINQSQVVGVNVSSFPNGKVEFVNNTYNGSATLTAAVMLLSTNNISNVFAGPVEFVVPTNDTWNYSIVKAGSSWSFGSDNVITEGADKADL